MPKQYGRYDDSEQPGNSEQRARPFFDPHAMDGHTIGQGNILPRAIVEHLGIDAQDLRDMDSVTNHDPRLMRIFDIMAMVARAQSDMPRVGFTRLGGELMRMAMAGQLDDSPLRFTVLTKQHVSGDFNAMFGALVVSDISTGEQPKPLFALIGFDRRGENVFDSSNSAVIFADPSLMTEERSSRATAVCTHMAASSGMPVGDTDTFMQRTADGLAQNVLLGLETHVNIYPRPE